MKKTLNKVVALLTAACLLLCLLLPLVQGASLDEDTITLSTAQDLVDLSKNCALDTWSQGKTVVLADNIDLTGLDFVPIPTFGGTFLGQGHSITGLRITASGSHMGLFRYLQKGAVVRDLRVSGVVTPGGTRSVVGGIAGVNRGIIENCSFLGTVQGEATVGGIAGQNEETGQIAGCVSAGIVTGVTCTGGITGRNLGILLKCQNRAGVNRATPDTSLTEDLSGLGNLSQTDLTVNVDGDSLLSDLRDTGGVAGYSGGVIQSCVNSGSVGYPHVGYNVGGVAGRQTGYLAGCSNSGAVYGRKDVGGIVGQAEPDVVLIPTTDTLTQLRKELDTLETMIDQTLDHTDDSRGQISAQLSAMGETADSAKDSSKELLDQVADFADDNLDTINSLSISLTAALDRLSPALDDLSEAAGQVEDLADSLSQVLDTLDKATDVGDDALEETVEAIEHLREAGTYMDRAVQKVKDALADLQKVIYIDSGHETEVQKAVADLSAATGDLGKAVTDVGSALDEVSGSWPTLPFAEEEEGDSDEEAVSLGEAMQNMGDALSRMGKDLSTITTYTHFDQTQLTAALKAMSSALTYGEQAADRMDEALSDLEYALWSVQDLSDDLGDALEQLQGVVDIASSMGGKLKSAFTTMGDAVDRLAEEGPFTFTPLGQGVRDTGTDLYDAISRLSGEATTLQELMDQAGDTLSADLRAISRQLNKVFDLVLDALEDVEGVVERDADDLIEDTSDEDISGTRQGKITECSNTGPIQGDRNVGGIVGAMSIEYDLDPEDEDTRVTLGSTFETKAVLQSSINRGEVTAKRDCAGGMVGNMDLGTTVDCQNYGNVSSTDGSYVGGVAGLSLTTLRNSYAKCSLSGANHIGGIAGWGAKIADCAAIVTITEGTEYLGAVAGEADLEENGLRRNVFVDTGVAGIDSVSYAGIAEPIDFETLRQRSQVPEEFVSFTLTLLADERQVASIPFQYGEDLAHLQLPAVPEKEGYYGLWPEFDTSGLRSDLVIEADYRPLITLLASDEQEGKLALALADGAFTEEASLHVKESTVPPPETGSGEVQADVWEVKLEGTDLSAADRVPLRLLDRRGGKAAVYQLVNGQWQAVETTVNGHYLLLTMEGSSGTFCVCTAQTAISPLAVLSAAGAALLLLLMLRHRRAKKKKSV